MTLPMAFRKPLIRIIFIHIIFPFSVSEQVAKQNYTLGFLVPYSGLRSSMTKFPGHSNSERYAQAILIALNDVKNDTRLLRNVNLKWVLNDTMCDELVGIRQQQWQQKFGVDVFIGPGCYCATAGRNAAAFNKPMMSYKCLDYEISLNRQNFPTVARTSMNYEHITLPLIALLKHFKWKRVGIVTRDVRKWTRTETYLAAELKKANITVALTLAMKIRTPFFEPLKENIQRTLAEIRKKARIVILLMEHADTTEFMYTAYDEYVQTGEYVFISFYLNPDGNYHKYKFKWHFSHYHGPTTLMDNIKSFASLLIISVRPNESKRYTEFQNEIKHVSFEEPFKTDAYSGCSLYKNKTVKKCGEWKNNTKTGESLCVKYVSQTKPYCVFWRHTAIPPYHAGHLYDAIVQYAYALNQTLAKNLSANGLNIIDQLRGHSYDSIFGFKMTFNENADVIFNVTLLDQQPSHDKTHCLEMEGPCKTMKTMAVFWSDPKNSGRQIYKQIVRRKIWYKRGTKVPPDTPPCGFLSEHCKAAEKADNSTKIIVGVSIPLGFLFLLLLLIIYRKRRIFYQRAQDGNTMLIES